MLRSAKSRSTFPCVVSAIFLVVAADVAAQIEPPAAGESRQAPLMAVMPIVNYSGAADGPKIILPLIYRELSSRGQGFVSADDLRPTLRQHRIRSTGEISQPDAQAIREATGTHFLLLASVDIFESGENPEVAVSARLLDPGSMTIIAAGTAAATGEDFAGLFGIGRIRSADKLAAHVIGDLFRSLDECRSGSSRADSSQMKCRRIVIVPLDNVTSVRYAGEVASRVLLAELVRQGFEVVEPGMVTAFFIQRRTLPRGEVDLATVQQMAEAFKPDLVVTGSVETWLLARGLTEESQPQFEYGARVLDVPSGRILATYGQFTGGNDGETVFRLGRCHALGRLVDRSFAELARAIARDRERTIARLN